MQVSAQTLTAALIWTDQWLHIKMQNGTMQANAQLDQVAVVSRAGISAAGPCMHPTSLWQWARAFKHAACPAQAGSLPLCRTAVAVSGHQGRLDAESKSCLAAVHKCSERSLTWGTVKPPWRSIRPVKSWSM